MDSLVTFSPNRLTADFQLAVIPATQKDACRPFSRATDVVVSEGVEALSACAFLNCRRLKRITLPATLKRIGAYAFYGCISLESIVIPEGVAFEPDSFGNYRTFARCECLHTVVLPSAMEAIPRDFFACCGALRLVQMPKALKRIEAGAFRRCEWLKILDLPDGVEDISPTAFSGCPAGEWISGGIPRLQRDYGGMCAGSAGTLLNVKEHPHIAWTRLRGQAHVKIRGGGSLRAIMPGDLAYLESLEEIVIPEGVLIIAAHAFEGCSRLRSVTLPKSLTYLGFRAFGGCTALEQLQIPEGVWVQQEPFDRDCVRIPPGIQSFAFPWEAAPALERDVALRLHGLQLEKGVLTRYFGPGGHVTVPEGVEEIGPGAFSGCDKLTAIALPVTLKKIGCNSFYRCRGLKELVIPEGVVQIEKLAFSGCDTLEQVSLPSTLRSVGRCAFAGDKLRKIKCAAVIADCGPYVFGFGGQEGTPYAQKWETENGQTWLCKKDYQKRPADSGNGAASWAQKKPAPKSVKKSVLEEDYPHRYVPDGNPDLYDRRDLARWANEGLKWEWEQSHGKSPAPEKAPAPKPAPKAKAVETVRIKTQEELDDEYLNSLSYNDLNPYPLDPRAREIIQGRNRRHYGR